MKFIHDRLDTILHYNMSFVGGFLGTYALLLRSGNFGSAQTGNLMEMMIDISEGNMHDFLARFGALIIFGLSLVISYLLANYTSVSMRKLCLWVDAVGLVIAAFIPTTVYPVIALYPIFAIASFQWGTYAGAKGYNSASIFSTNNFRQCVWGWTQFAITHDKKALEKAELYTFTVLSFLTGALTGSFATNALGTYGAFIGLIPLVTARIFILLG